jgi:hypothetical protein
MFMLPFLIGFVRKVEEIANWLDGFGWYVVNVVIGFLPLEVGQDTPTPTDAPAWSLWPGVIKPVSIASVPNPENKEGTTCSTSKSVESVKSVYSYKGL